MDFFGVMIGSSFALGSSIATFFLLSFFGLIFFGLLTDLLFLLVVVGTVSTISSSLFFETQFLSFSFSLPNMVL